MNPESGDVPAAPEVPMFLSLLLSVSQAASLNVAGQPVHEMTLQAGHAADRVLFVENDGTEPLRAVVYVQDAAASGEGPSNRAWVRFTPRELTVAPGEIARVPYRVEVPADVGLGTFESVFVVEEARGEPVWPPPADPSGVDGDAASDGERRTVRVVTLVGMPDEDPGEGPEIGDAR
jgi:hypothetical protein